MNKVISTKMRSGGEILLDGLIAHGASRFFCVPGESYLAALDALVDRTDKLAVITCRQEGGAAYMAEAHGKLTGSPGICFCSRGPGAANAMIGVHTAFQDSTPMLLFIGQISRADVGREAFQALDYQLVYAGVAKKVMKINDAARIPEQLGQAWNTAVNGRPGPVVVELPEDMLKQQAQVRDLPPIRIALPAPSTESMQKFAALLRQAQDPLLLIGGAGWTAAANEWAQQFSERHGIAVATAFRRSSSFDNTHAHYIGELGLAPNPKLVEQFRNSDLIIAVGARLGDITTAGYTTLTPPLRDGCNPSQKLVHIHISGDEIGAVFCVDLGIVSQPENFLKMACTLAYAGAPNNGNNDRSKKDRSPQDKKQRLQQGHQCYLDWLNQTRNVGSKVRMEQIMQHLRSRLDSDSIITVGAGNFSVWGQRNYQFTRPNTFLGSTNGSMGYGVPSAISAKLENPDCTVVSFSGDGCFMMNGQELATAMQYRANVIFLVVNNGRLGTIRNHQEAHYPNRVSATELENPDFVALAKAYGAYSERVTQTADFPPAFENALKANLPAVIEIQVDY